ncbi:hypothetical protein ACIQPR_09625 [Streptomyces sp. NPDC091280]|uniref:hypothetical protein n=1 Tax=Streptomyces sp. NPDC091280 TaxID=3365984 RepID=UPI0037F28999
MTDAVTFAVSGDLDALDVWLEPHGWAVNRELPGKNGGVVLYRWADWSLMEVCEGDLIVAVTRPDLTTGISVVIPSSRGDEKQ